MAGRRKAAAPAIPSNSMVASAVRYGTKAARIYEGAQEWQKEAYRHYAICGEARYAANYYGNALSRSVLYVAETDAETGEEKPVPSGSTAKGYLDELFNGREGQEAMLKALGIHLTVAGECYLIGRKISQQELDDMPPGADSTEDIWEIASVLEVKVKGTNWSVVYGKNKTDIPLTDDDVVIRIWLPMPGDRMKADSPFRSLLPVLTEIEWSTKHVFAQVSSRLTGAGILWVPEGMKFPDPPERKDDDDNVLVYDNDADQFMATLAEAMLTPMQDPGNPAGVVPIIATVPNDLVDKAKLMHFWSDLDEKALEIRNDNLRRFALGMDLPPEKVLGMSANAGTGGGTSNGVSHWGAWQIDEDTIKLHIEPMLDVICNSLTIAYLRPLTEDDSRIRANTAALRLRPDRSKEAIMLWDRMIITTEACVREVGFKSSDILAIDSDEFRARVLLKIASGSATPEQVQAAASELGVDIEVAMPAEYQRPREARPAPSLEDKETRDLPEAASLVLAASVPLVFRALERAGNRLRGSAKGEVPVCASYETHLFIATKDPAYVLDDAWACAEQSLAGIVSDPKAVIDVLDSYTRSLLATQSPHTPAMLKSWLTQAQVAA